MKNFAFAAAALFAAAFAVAPASAQQTTVFGAGIGVIGLSGSGTLSGTFARNVQSGGATGYGMTESFANAGSGIGAGINPNTFSASGFANSGSASQSGSMVNGTNGSASNLTGGFGLSGAGLGAAGVVGFGSN